MTARSVVRGVTRAFGEHAGVFDVDLTVAAGEVHALVGLNGAGKTTLLRVMLGMLSPASGEVFVDGAPIGSLPSKAWARVGHMVDDARGYPDLRLRDNLRIAARLNGVPRERLTAVTAHAVDALGLHQYTDVATKRLSHGNRRRMCIAMALQHDPTLVVLDEPTNGLDPTGVILLRDLLRRHAGGGAGVLVSSHHLDEVARVADRVTVINRGRVVGPLPPGQREIERAFFAMVRAHDETIVP